MEIAGEMPKHRVRSTELEEKPIKLVKAVKVVKAVAEEELTLIRLRVDGIYKVTGKVSGRGYQFNGAGSVENVDKKDVDWILSLRQGKGCCGGGGGNPVFELAGE